MQEWPEAEAHKNCNRVSIGGEDECVGPLADVGLEEYWVEVGKFRMFTLLLKAVGVSVMWC